jgi:tetratricopeptide (TPR) repeat protein
LPAVIPVQLSSRESLENLSELLPSLAKNIEVITSLSDLVAFQPTSEDYFKLGNACFFEERYEDAIANFDKSLELNPDYSEAFANRCVSLNQLGRNS